MNTYNYNKGDIIFRQGDAADSMYELLWGSVGIYLGYGTENEKRLTVLDGDTFFGEMGMIDHEPRSATAVALEDHTQLKELREDDLARYFRERPTKVLMIMQQLSERLRKLTVEYTNACRTAAGVMKLEEQSGKVAQKDREEVEAQVEHYARMRVKGYYVTV